MPAKYTYYLLADSSEGIKKETELTGKRPPEYKAEGDICKGFVYKRLPHLHEKKRREHSLKLRRVGVFKVVDAKSAKVLIERVERLMASAPEQHEHDARRNFVDQIAIGAR